MSLKMNNSNKTQKNQGLHIFQEEEQKFKIPYNTDKKSRAGTTGKEKKKKDKYIRNTHSASGRGG